MSKYPAAVILQSSVGAPETASKLLISSTAEGCDSFGAEEFALPLFLRVSYDSGVVVPVDINEVIKAAAE